MIEDFLSDKRIESEILLVEHLDWILTASWISQQDNTWERKTGREI